MLPINSIASLAWLRLDDVHRMESMPPDLDEPEKNLPHPCTPAKFLLLPLVCVGPRSLSALLGMPPHFFFFKECRVRFQTMPADLSAALSVLRPTETPPFSTCFASNSLALRGSDLAKLISRSSCSGVIFVGAPDRDRSDNDSSPSFSHAVRVDPTVLGCTPIASATSFVDKPSLSSRIVSARSRWRQLLPRRTMFVSVDRHRSSS